MAAAMEHAVRTDSRKTETMTGVSKWTNKRGTWERTQLGESLTITIEVDRVRGQGRPRLSKYGAYEDKADKEAKREIADAWRAMYGGIRHHMLCDEVEVEITTTRHLPQSKPQWREYQADTSKPDIDNISKLVLDALTGVAWNVDDAAVTRLVASKDRRRYLDRDLITITVRYFTNVFYH